MAGLSISRAWDESKAILARDGRLLFSVALALIVLPATVLALIAPPQETADTPGWVRIVSLCVVLIGIAGQIAIIRLAIESSMTVGQAIGHAFKRLLSTFTAVLLLAFAFALIMVPIFMAVAGSGGVEAAAAGQITPGASRAVLLLLLVVLLIGARFQLITPIGAAETIGPVAILKRSWQLSKGHYWRLLAFLLLTMFLALIFVVFLGQVVGGVVVGALLGGVEQFSVGALVAGLIGGIAQAAFSIIVSVMMARIYVQLFGASAQASVPSSTD